MSGPGAIAKPTVFLSHAVTDQPIAQVIHDEITRIFAGGVRVYASSVPGVVKPGEDWLASIRDNLTAATAVIVIVTPVSVNRPWIWFEVGASWSKMEQDQGVILPLVYGVPKAELPEPLGRLQAMSLEKAAETREVFQTLVTNFGFGNLKGYRHAGIKARLPKYSDFVVSEADLGSGQIYTGPYATYSSEELRELLDDWIYRQWTDYEEHKGIGYRAYSWGENFFTGLLVHFRELDRQLDLPPGTARDLLNDVVVSEEYPIQSYRRTENTIRYTIDDDRYDDFVRAYGGPR